MRRRFVDFGKKLLEHCCINITTPGNGASEYFSPEILFSAHASAVFVDRFRTVLGGRMGTRTDKRIDGQTTDERTNGQTDGRTDGQTYPLREMRRRI